MEYPQYNSELVSKIETELMKIDKTNLLNDRRKFLATVLAAVQDESYERSNIKLIEMRSNPFDHEVSSHYRANIAYFFANNPEFMKYKGFDKDADKEHPLIKEGVLKNRNRFIKKPEIILRNIQEQLIEPNLYDIVKEFNTNRDLVVFSNLVLGVADEKFPVWNFPGLQIHRFLKEDFEIGSCLDNKQHEYVFRGPVSSDYKTLKEKIKTIYGINKQFEIFEDAESPDKAYIIYKNI